MKGKIHLIIEAVLCAAIVATVLIFANQNDWSYQISLLLIVPLLIIAICLFRKLNRYVCPHCGRFFTMTEIDCVLKDERREIKDVKVRVKRVTKFFYGRGYSTSALLEQKRRIPHSKKVNIYSCTEMCVKCGECRVVEIAELEE
ncbi:MAG: hypothetical protein IKV39_01675 [Clostridia bacterium]|nr:hypothetical protein [Clostridia bacterium]